MSCQSSTVYFTVDCYEIHSVDQSNCCVGILAGSIKENQPIVRKFTFYLHVTKFEIKLK